jgi:hypothetical protein
MAAHRPASVQHTAQSVDVGARIDRALTSACSRPMYWRAHGNACPGDDRRPPSIAAGMPNRYQRKTPEIMFS